MIYLITGVPGSGKSLYAVGKLVQDLLKDVPEGIEKRRLVVDGIPDLVIEHDQMAPCKFDDDKKVLTCQDGDGINRWHEWAKPGDLLVLDEVQRYWRPRAMGSKVPEYIAQLETHRHKGIDLVLITQNPMLLDQNVRRLVGRHIHVRRILGMQRAMLYDWDGCQADPHRIQSATKTMWAYPKDAYKLYKSSELHLKQKQKIPAWMVLPVLAIAGAAFVVPKATTLLHGAATGQGIASAPSKPAPTASSTVTTNTTTASTTPAIPPASSSIQSTEKVATTDQPTPTATAETSKLQIAGCIRTAKKCGCVDSDGMPVETEPGFCESRTTSSGPPKNLGPDSPISPEVLAAFLEK